MRRLLVCLACLVLTGSIFANDDEVFEKGIQIGQVEPAGENAPPLTDLESEPSSIVANCINVITGHYFEVETDVTLPSAQPLVIQRSYSSSDCSNGSMCVGWNFNHHGVIQEFHTYGRHDTKRYHVNLLSGFGAQTIYDHVHDDKYKVSPKFIDKGYTNIGSGVITGKTHALNDRLYYKKDAKEWQLKTGSGSVLHYSKRKGSRLAYLTKEVNCNGNTTHYSYDVYNRVVGIDVKNRVGASLANVTFLNNYQRRKNKDVAYSVHTHDGRSCNYLFSKISPKWGPEGYYLVQAEPIGAPTVRYQYETDPEVRLSKKIYPRGYLEIEYFKKGGYSTLGGWMHVYNDMQDPLRGRVKSLKAPVGCDATPHITHNFFYCVNRKEKDGKLEILNGCTKVFDISNNMTNYEYNNEQRLTSVEKYTGSSPHHQLYSREKLVWGAPSSHLRANLISRVFETNTGKALYCKHFHYDGRGNVVNELLCGDLTGWCEHPLAVNSDGSPQYNGIDMEVKNYTYAGHRQNQMVNKTENGVFTTYEYVPGTDLLAKKLTLVNGEIKIREFNKYDENSALIEQITDDGATADRDDLTGVTERRIKRITSTTTHPKGMPLYVEERYLDLSTNEEVLLELTVNHYCAWGRLVKQDVYGAHQAFAYSKCWQYDYHGNVIKETTPEGYEINRAYDSNHKLVFEQGPRPGFHKEFTYDYSNRLIRQDLVYDSGERLFETFHYDLLGNKVAEVDVYGNKTDYMYDNFGRVTHTILPAVFDENGDVTNPFSNVKYNELSHPVEKRDPHGKVTQIRNTIRGKPCHVVFPDGSQEISRYNIDGTLQSVTAVNGTKTVITYDYFQRPISKVVTDVNGQVLDSEYKTYSTLHLTSETDAAGQTTTYRYDYAGRLVERIKGSSRSTYEYDVFGRQNRTTEYFGTGASDYVVNVKEFDVAGNVVEEREEDANGLRLKKISYQYDEAGNTVLVQQELEQGLATSYTEYDALNRPTKIQNPENQITVIRYRTDHRNALGQVVACTETTDPAGIVTITEEDAINRIASVTKLNSMGKVLQKRSLVYDTCNNLVAQEDVNFAGDTEKVVKTLREYDICHRMTALVEAVGSPEQRRTEYVYNAYGQREQIIKPDGVILFQTYDALNRLQEVKSSDGSIHYCYQYDSLGHMIDAHDIVNDLHTIRTYDEFGNMSSETLQNGLEIAYEYDGLGRMSTVRLPDGSGIEYQYHASQLQEVRRMNKAGEVQYRYECTKYDLAGRLLEAQPMGNLPKVNYQYDLIGRLLKTDGPQWSETISGYDDVGNLLGRSIEDAQGGYQGQYKYDDLNQIVEENGDIQNTFAWDSFYNRTEKNGAAHTYNQLNQLLYDGKYSYSYDLNGNILSKTADGQTIQYKYDAWDRLISITNEDGTTYRHTYDENHRRLSTESPQGIKKFLYTYDNEIASVSSDGTVAEFRMLASARHSDVGATVAIEVGGGVYFPMHDHNENIVSLVDAATGNVFEHYRYSAFGEETLYGAGANPWRFSSKRTDAETGLVYFGRRFYEPRLGRWLTPDPIGYEGGINLYAYVNNNPLMNIDPNGLFGLSSLASLFDGMTLGFTLDNSLESIKQVAKTPGRAIEIVGQHLVPIPVVRDVFEIAGRLCTGCGLEGYVPSYSRPHSGFYYIDRPEQNKMRKIIMINGIMTSYEEAEKRALELSNRLNGERVYFVWNASQGLSTDCLEWMLQRMGIMTNSTDKFTGAMNYLIDDMGGPDTGGIIHTIAHSQGAEITNNLVSTMSRLRRECMHVYTLGPAKYASAMDFGAAYNHVNTRDPVSFICDPIGSYKMMRKDPHIQGEFHSSNGFFGADHLWDSDGYQHVLRTITREIKKSNV